MKVKAPTQAVNGDLFLDNKSLNCIRYRAFEISTVCLKLK